MKHSINVVYDMEKERGVISTKFNTILEWKKRDYHWTTTFRGFKMNLGCMCIYGEPRFQAPGHHFQLSILLYKDKDNYIVKEIGNVETKKIPIFLEQSAIKFINNYIKQFFDKVDK